MADHRFEHGAPLHEVGYADVRFAAGLHATQLEQLHDVLIGMDEDAMLHLFRRHAGLPAPGTTLPGHYQGFDAESFGSYLSGLARYFAISGDERTRDKLGRLIREFERTVEATGRIFPRLYGTAISTVKYSRIIRALIDAHSLADNELALGLIDRVTDAVEPHLPREVGDASAAGWSLIMSESSYHAWQYTGDERHLDIANRNLYREFFDRLAAGENCLGGRNALAHMDALSCAARGYLVTGEQALLDAALNGFAFVEQQSYATGGWGPNECFLPQWRPFGEPVAPDGWMPPIDTLAQSLTRTHHHFQMATGAYSHFTIARYLLRITKDPHYGDSMERLMYNTVLGSLPLRENGMSACNTDYHEDGRKNYFDNYGWAYFGPLWPLEAAVLPLVATDYRINAYFRDDAGVYVNLYIPSTLTWEQDGEKVSLTQSGTYPLGDRITLVVDTPAPRTFEIRLRIPAWSVGASIAVDGARVEDVTPGTFAALRREWRAGARIELVLPRELTLEPIDDTAPDLVALVYDPIVLFAVTPLTPRFTREQLLSASRPDESGSEWRVDTNAGSTRFLPYWEFDHERYTTYHDVV